MKQLNLPYKQLGFLSALIGGAASLIGGALSNKGVKDQNQAQIQQASQANLETQAATAKQMEFQTAANQKAMDFSAQQVLCF